MPLITDDRSTTHTAVVRAQLGECISKSIAVALARIEAGSAYAYVDCNGVIITLDSSSTAQTAWDDYGVRVGVKCRAREKQRQREAGVAVEELLQGTHVVQPLPDA